MKQTLYKIIFVFFSLVIAGEQTWTTTTFDYYWNVAFRRNMYREPISFTPFNVKVGQLTYGGKDYWDSGLLSTNLGKNLPVVLDSTTTTFSIIDNEEYRKLLMLEVDFLRINATNYLYKQNLLDIQFGLGYSRLSSISNPVLPNSDSYTWYSSLPNANTRGSFRFKPLINTFNVNTTLTFQVFNFMLGYMHHALGYSFGTLYESTGGDYYLEGNGTNESFALGLQGVFHPKNSPFSFVYGIEGRLNRTKFLSVDDPSHISHIKGLDLYAKGIVVTFGTIFGGKRTTGDNGFSHLINQRYIEATKGFEQFINSYPTHSKRKRAEEMLAFGYEQIPYQQFREGLESLRDKDLESAAQWLNKATETADDDLLFEINSRKKDLAMVLIDSVASHKQELTFLQAEDLILKARKIAPDYPLCDEALAELYIEKVDVLLNNKNFSRAHVYLKKALEVSPDNKNQVANRQNDLIDGLMDEANNFTEQEEFILAINALNTIIDIHPKRQDDLGPIIDYLRLKLNHAEQRATQQKVKELMSVKRKERAKPENRVLLLGITKHESKLIMGEADFIDIIEKSGKVFEMWTFTNHKKAKRLYFENHLLIKIDK